MANMNPWLLILSILSLCWSGAAAATTTPTCTPRLQDPNRVALVIGNADYGGGIWRSLKNPQNDARIIAQRLCELGFDVRSHENADLRALGDALRDFRARLAARANPIGFFYFSGHGMRGAQPPPSTGDDTYLVPVRPEGLATTEDAPYRALGLEQVIGSMRQGFGVNDGVGIVVLDMSRSVAPPSGFKSATKGLAAPQASEDFLIAYATRAGDVVPDGDVAVSLYTDQLQQRLQAKPDQDLSVLFKQVRAAVISTTEGKQQPQVLDMSSRPVVLFGGDRPGELRVTSDPEGATIYVDGILRGQAPLTIGRLSPDKAVTVRATAQGYTDGERQVLVEATGVQPIAMVLSPVATKARLSVQTQPARASVVIIGGPEYRPGIELPVGSYEIAVSAPDHETLRQRYQLSRAEEVITVRLPTISAADPFESLTGKMLDIAGNVFTMGEDFSDDDEKPQHFVSIKGFRLGRFEVTVKQWQVYRYDVTGAPRGCGEQDDMPIACVSWQEVQSYLLWLNRKTGKSYRLPTEAEWDFAARAGTRTKFPWGDTYDPNRANGDGVGGKDRWKELAPVGQFEPNALGLHDMIGNVAEWTHDCYRAGYEGAPTDGSARVSRFCGERVVRGVNGLVAVTRSEGPIWNPRQFVDHLPSPVSRRRSSSASSHMSDVGFRLAHDL